MHAWLITFPSKASSSTILLVIVQQYQGQQTLRLKKQQNLALGAKKFNVHSLKHISRQRTYLVTL